MPDEVVVPTFPVRICAETGHRCKYDGFGADCCADWTQIEATAGNPELQRP